MSDNLVIVESPAKANTINKYLGRNYKVVASNGHVRDLPKSTMGIDVNNDFEPKYITIRGKGELLSALKKEVKKADKIFLATDPDREGEAISWHLKAALNLNDTDKKVYRITFNEITKNAIKESLKAPRDIDMGLVDAQQARRILDRIVGYSISPVLWDKVKSGLSAGRVQSAALKLICDREKEIEEFDPEEYWTIDMDLSVEGTKKPVTARYYGENGNKKDVTTEEEAQRIIDDVRKGDVKVIDVKEGTRAKKAPLPFTTSTMQQEAAKRLGFSAQKTMRIAQQLYEGVNIKGHGSNGLITYLRTDSTRISDEAAANALAYISEHYGKDYAKKAAPKETGSQRIQDAHEAIRPAHMEFSPAVIKDSLSRDQLRLYQLIWNRFLASFMKDALYDTTSVRIEAGKHEFRVNASKVSFDGFLAVYSLSDDEEEKDGVLPVRITTDTDVKLKDITGDRHFTQPPAHYTEASLIKTLEDLGIGRPSTYAPTISTLLNRHYIGEEKKNIFVTDLGDVVNGIMEGSFPRIADADFSAKMENELDSVAEGKTDYKKIIRDFYPGLVEDVEKAEKDLTKVKVQDEVSDVVCDKCGRMMVIKYGPHGKFLACPGFPECRNTKTYYEKTGVKCPKCGGDIVVRRTKKGRRYYGCENNPDCDFMTWQRPVDKKCPKCGSVMVERGNRLACSDPECGYSENPKKKAK
ncbi:MAG: type I DNA topoisomerase [Lachnospiraceae bacterium]|nr:type I DNA topoisomerase [Lachnospiraceae bacterium]